MNAAHGWTGRKVIRMADDRLISLNAAIDAFKKALTVGEWKGNYVTICSAIGYEGAKHILESLPTVDAVPVVHGRWKEDPSGYGFWICSACGFVSEASAADMLYKFCPVCGAKMCGKDGEQHE